VRAFGVKCIECSKTGNLTVNLVDTRGKADPEKRGRKRQTAGTELCLHTTPQEEEGRAHVRPGMADEFSADAFSNADDSVEGLPQAPKVKKKKKKKKAAADTTATSLTGGETYGNDLFEDQGGGDEEEGPAGRAQGQSDFDKGASVFSDEDMQKCARPRLFPLLRPLLLRRVVANASLVVAGSTSRIGTA